MDDAHRGDAALAASNPKLAISHYSKAIAASPDAAGYYIKRSTAYTRSSQHQAALKDADTAVILATKRAKRELIAQAQLRRGIALYQLGRYVDADFVLTISQKLNDKDKSLGVWKAKAVSQLKGKSVADREKELTVTGVPQVSQDTTVSHKENLEGSNVNEKTNSATKNQPASNVPNAPVQTPANKIRHDWYQNNEKVFITLLAKGVPKDQTTIDLREQALSLSFPLVNGSVFDFSLDPLFAKVNVESSTSTIMPSKIEFVLHKVQSGLRWTSLEGIAELDEPYVHVSSPSLASSAAAPSYPTSSRSGPKDWDKIVQSYVRVPSKDPAARGGEEEAVDKANDDFIDDDFEDGDPVNGFFKKLYAGASDDTKRAMMKSYQESGGTALSTNWDEVKQEKVKVSPPTGMEEKKWEY